MSTAFDREIDRAGTRSVKFDLVAPMFGVHDAIPMWVADADYAAPDFVLDAIRTRLSHPILGYSLHTATYKSAVRDWLRFRFRFSIDSDDSVLTAIGVVPALATCVRAFTVPGDSVALFSPVYYPFFNVVRANGRRVVDVPLVRRSDDHGDSRYEIDFDAFEAALIAERPRLLLLCHPHNPVGRVWTLAELRRIGDLCLQHSIVVVSDEIWAPLTLPVLADAFVEPASAPKRQFVPFACARDDGAFRHITVTCTSATKSFNLAALQDSAIIIENPVLRVRWLHEIDAQGIFSGNFAGPHATEACYSERGRAWLDAAVLHIAGNVQFARRAFAFGLEQADSASSRDTPSYPLGIRANQPEGTYLVWLDCRELLARLERCGYNGMSIAAAPAAAPATHSDALVDAFNKRVASHTPLDEGGPNMMQMPRSLLLDFFSERCGVCFDDGMWFGSAGNGFVRMNVATPRSTLQKALAKISAGVKALDASTAKQ